MTPDPRPLVLVTGAAGDLGSALVDALGDDYRIVGLDRRAAERPVPIVAVDLADDASVARALAEVRDRFGASVASVVHLAAYFDFTGEDHPLYRSVNVEGTRRLLRGLHGFDLGQFVYAGTMLVHRPTAPGGRIDEDSPIEPRWAYPRSKAEAEAAIVAERGDVPVVLLHLAGVYGDRRCVPTLAHQIARIYERDLKSHLYSGDPDAGQSMLHREDMADAFRRTVDRRAELPPLVTILVGEPRAPGYGELQDTIGRLVHGDAHWATLRVPKPVARVGAGLERAVEPLVPDALDAGREPFVRPFMVAMADDHYALDVGRARRLLGWQPRHRLLAHLPALVEALRRDPLGWYAANGIEPPAWMRQAGDAARSPDALRRRDERRRRALHARHAWAPLANAGLGAWLASAPLTVPIGSTAMAVNDVVAGLALIACATLALSWRATWARWACAAIGTWLMFAPLVFWAPTGAGYLNDTLVGMLVVAFAVALPPEPGVSAVAATTGPASPPGWDYNPSAWLQRLPVILLAVVGLLISRHLAGYQLGHLPGLWDPFFAGGPDPRNGSEEIVTSSVSRAWPVPDAGVGAMTYALEILTGVVGSQRRWRTMPWLVLLFGLMIVPLGAVSIFFIVIQPIWIGTWCTPCLIAAAAMLAQIPYSLDELLATGQFLLRRRRAGRPLLHVLIAGDTDDRDDGRDRPRPEPAFVGRTPRGVLRDMWAGGVNLPWNLALAIAIGVWLMFTRVTVGAQGAVADVDHVVGSLAITIAAFASAEVGRVARFALVPLGAALVVAAFVLDASFVQRASAIACGIALAVLAWPRGPVRCRVGGWERFGAGLG